MMKYDDVYLGDGVSMTSDEFRSMQGLDRGALLRPGELDLILADVVAAGLEIQWIHSGILVGDRFVLNETVRTFEASTTFGLRTYGYRNASDLIMRLDGSQWEQSEEARKRAAYRERKADEEDELRRRAYEAIMDRRIQSGNFACSGGTRSVNSVSGFHGVHWTPSIQKWGAVVLRPRVREMPTRETGRRAGFFETRVEAALAFDRMNVSMRGRYAKTNFPRGSRFVDDGHGGYAVSPDGRRYTAPHDLNFAETLRSIEFALAEPFWEEMPSVRVDPKSMPLNYRRRIQTMYADPPSYDGLVPYADCMDLLNDLQLPCAFEIVSKVNHLRALAFRELVSRREFPVDRTKLMKLVKEFRRGYRKVMPQPVLLDRSEGS